MSLCNNSAPDVTNLLKLEHVVVNGLEPKFSTNKAGKRRASTQGEDGQ
ncbi:uncharacterized protein METZ01_LOCUS8510 [marine metagenome]|uniref:Uncharacterized protein n=1 Tax=marine metagenome TaxID=408172 RepID=A0A381NM21_9ZZZZ